MIHALLLPLLLVGCRSEGQLSLLDPEVRLDILSPEYGEFMGDEAVLVSGVVSPAMARVYVEGEEVVVDDDGGFVAELPVGHSYRNIDVTAFLQGASDRARVPVFDGRPPAETWPGGATLRLTPQMLSQIGESLGGEIDALGWEDQILQLIPTVPIQGFELVPQGVSHDPTVVVLEPTDGGIDVGILFSNVTIDFITEIDLGGFVIPVPVAIGIEEVRITALAVPEVDEEGMLSLTLSNADVVMGDPIVDVLLFDMQFLEPILQQAGGFLEPIGELLLGGVVDLIGTIPLGGPYAFDTELMGTAVEARLSDVYGEVEGVGAGLGIGIDEPALMGPLPMPTPVDYREEVHLAVGLHEGLLDVMVEQSGVIDMLSQDLELPGLAGDLIGNAITNLPGGGDAPEGEGWCLKLDPGTARVVRLQTGIEPMAELYLPDVLVNIGVKNGSSCDPWLTASMAFEVGLEVKNGTKIGMALEAPEGIILDYRTTDAWDEAEVVAELGSFLESSMGLLGGQISFDLADLTGGLGQTAGTGIPGLDGIEPRIIGCEPLLDEDGRHPEGLYSVSLSLLPQP